MATHYRDHIEFAEEGWIKTVTDDVSYEPMTPGYFNDPYPHYTELRKHNPVHETRFGFVMLLSFAEVLEAYRDEALSRDTRNWEDFRAWRRSDVDGPLEQMMANWLVMIDPPRHTPMRAIHDDMFGAGLLHQVQPFIAEELARLLDPIAKDGGGELVSGLADPLVSNVISYLLGIPRDAWKQFQQWSQAISATTESQLTTKVLTAGLEAQAGMYDELERVLASAPEEGGPALLHRLADVDSQGSKLSRQEVLDSAIFFYQAGHPTGSGAIALALLRLMEHPDQLELVRRMDPDALTSAVRELQRFDSPVQMNDRVALEDREVAGLPVRAGQLVRLCLASADRDRPELDGAGDVLDVTRTNSRNLGFGHGLHQCVAQALGERQTAAVLRAVLAAAPQLGLGEGKVRYLPSVSNRGLRNLPVTFGTA